MTSDNEMREEFETRSEEMWEIWKDRDQWGIPYTRPMQDWWWLEWKLRSKKYYIKDLERRLKEDLTHRASVDAWQDKPVFQKRVDEWMLACFGIQIAADKVERNHRFLEESLELVQACGATASECHQLVDYVFGRPIGEPHQELGGVMVTVAALANANNMSIISNGELELERIWTKVEQIRAKQAAKPKHSPLPAALEKHK